LPTWSWPGQEGKDLQVEVYSGADKVRLFLNDELIGEKPTGRDQEFKATFSVPYTPGTLKAVGMRGDQAIAESVLTTAGNAAALRVTADRTTIDADGQDLSFVMVEAVDAEGRFQPHADQEIQFSINGPGVIAAVGNGDGEDPAPYQGDRRKLFQGRALVVVRTSKQSGPITLTAKTPGLSDGTVTIQGKATAPRAELH
jgi:beta-galactosidase